MLSTSVNTAVIAPISAAHVRAPVRKIFQGSSCSLRKESFTWKHPAVLCIY